MGKFKQLLAETEINEFANIDKNLRGAGKHVGYGHGDVFHIQKSNGNKSPWYSAIGQKTKKVLTGPSLKHISQKLGESVNEGDYEKIKAAKNAAKRKEDKHFASAKREIDRLKKQGK